jgi:hypothetical protein
LLGTTHTSATFTGAIGHSYGFYSVATDNVGNIQPKPTTAQATTKVEAGEQTTISLMSSNASPTYGDSLMFTAVVAASQGGSEIPTGTVQFQIAGVNLGSPVKLTGGTAISEPITTLGAGSHTISAVYSGDSNFSGNSASISETVSPATLTVTANSLSINHGDLVPSLTFSLSGFVNGDTASVVSGTPVLSTSASSSSPAGRYPITTSVGSLAAANYTFTLVNGTLTVQPKVVDVRLDYGSKSISLFGLNRDLPFATIQAIDVIFSDNVAVNICELALAGTNIPNYSPSGFSYNSRTDDATWTLPSALGVDRLMMTLDGVVFAADKTIPVNRLGTSFSVLPGDINGDGVVNAQDLVLVRNAILGTGDPKWIGWVDLDGSGTVGPVDLNIVRKRLGTRLP